MKQVLLRERDTAWRTLRYTTAPEGSLFFHTCHDLLLMLMRVCGLLCGFPVYMLLAFLQQIFHKIHAKCSVYYCDDRKFLASPSNAGLLVASHISV